MSQKVILIFSKIPFSGFVKTRLTQNSCLSLLDVTRISEAMLKDTIVLASKSSADRVDIGYTPEKSFSVLKNLVESLDKDGYLKKSIHYHLQTGVDFDERFGSVIQASFDNDAENIIVLGSDLPYLNPKILNDSFIYLEQPPNNKKLVIGPASGGGIYLVGLNSSFKTKWFKKYNLFNEGIEISQFVHLCTNKKLQLYLTPAHGDIDLEEDLVSLIMYIEALSVSSKFKGYHYPKFTANILKELGLYVIEKKGETRRRKIAKK